MWKILISSLIASAAAIPTGVSRVVHEKRSALTSDHPSRSARVDGDAVLPVRIGLKQNNLDRGYAHLMDISHPSSERYGKHWTATEVAHEFEPSAHAVDSVLHWLRQSGIKGARQTRDKGWVAFDASAVQFQHLFGAELHEYTDASGAVRVGCEEYSLPTHLSPHVDFITPGVQLSPALSKRSISKKSSSKNAISRKSISKRTPLASPFTGHLGQRYSPLALENGKNWTAPGTVSDELAQCGRNITPPCIQALYDIPSPQANLDDGILGIFENGDLYSPRNLDQYFSTYAPYVSNGTRPDEISINGASANNSYNGGESDVDFDIAYSLLGKVPITLYQNAPNATVASGSYIMDGFFAAIDSAYCDDDTNSADFECGTVPSLASVISISYGGPESFFSTYAGQTRACNEFMKLSLQGHTFVVSSGDYGVAANPLASTQIDDGCQWDGCLARSPASNVTNSDKIFNPQFPASCPFVLSVGATQLEDNDTVDDPETVMYQPDLGQQQYLECPKAKTFFSSSGGFSNLFSQPSYQSSAVSSYFSAHDPGYPSYSLANNALLNNNMTFFPGNGIYNRAGRAIPDVSANGAKYNIFIGDGATQEAGTSLATPIWASMLAMINQKRKDAGKGPVGFVNTVLYEHPEVFNDITKGNNPGCGTHGFEAVEGWDPVTGLGTPNFPKLESLLCGLP